MKNSHRIFAALLALVALFSSCGGEQRKYVIGVSQCSDDSWRTKLQQELELSTYFNDEVQLVLCSANVCTQQGAMPPYPKELKERISLLDF